MAKFFGSYLDAKPVNLAVLDWLVRLNDSFYVFIEVEGGDFQSDFLVLKDNGIFNIEAKDWNVREMPIDADWILADGAKRKSPVYQVDDQCKRVSQYLFQIREQYLSDESAQKFQQHKDYFKIFPIIAISKDSNALIPAHRYFRIFMEGKKLRAHLSRFIWQDKCLPGQRELCMKPAEIEKLADILHLKPVDPRSLHKAKKTEQRDKVERAPGFLVTDNPYHYVYSVTGSAFYGREVELRRVDRALKSTPPMHIAVIGLQRTGKSSLASECIRRLKENSKEYLVLQFDFRSLWHEGLKKEEDITLELLNQLAASLGGIQPDVILEKYRAMAEKGGVIDQRRLFKESLQKVSRDKKVILFLDECQDINEALSESKYETFFSFVDSLCKDMKLGIRVILVCRPAFFDLDIIKKINLGRLFENILIGPLDEKAAYAIVEKGDGWLQFEDDAKKRILFLTGKHPYWLQFFCHRIFEKSILCSDLAIKASFPVTLDIVNQTFYEIVKDGGCKPHFLLLYQDIEKDEVASSLLYEIADKAVNEGQSVLLSSLGERWRDKKLLRQGLPPLVDNQVLLLQGAPHSQQISFSVEALRYWMRSNLITLA